MTGAGIEKKKFPVIGGLNFRDRDGARAINLFPVWCYCKLKVARYGGGRQVRDGRSEHGDGWGGGRMVREQGSVCARVHIRGNVCDACL